MSLLLFSLENARPHALVACGFQKLSRAFSQGEAPGEEQCRRLQNGNFRRPRLALIRAREHVCTHWASIVRHCGSYSLKAERPAGPEPRSECQRYPRPGRCAPGKKKKKKKEKGKEKKTRLQALSSLSSPFSFSVFRNQARPPFTASRVCFFPLAPLPPSQRESPPTAAAPPPELHCQRDGAQSVGLQLCPPATKRATICALIGQTGWNNLSSHVCITSSPAHSLGLEGRRSTAEHVAELISVEALFSSFLSLLPSKKLEMRGPLEETWSV